MNFVLFLGASTRKVFNKFFQTLFLSQEVFLFTMEDRRRSEVLENKLEKQRDKFQAIKFKHMKKEFAENFIFTK